MGSGLGPGGNLSLGTLLLLFSLRIRMHDYTRNGGYRHLCPHFFDEHMYTNDYMTEV